jgi:hypothetical protein
MAPFRRRLAGNASTQPPGWQVLFVALWLFIILVSVVDGYLVLRFRNFIEELNPQARALIEFNDGKVWYLLAAKFAGTVIACTLLLLVHHYSVRLGTAVAGAIAGLQLCLLLYLALA